MANLKTKLSSAMLALIAAGASAPVLMDQFLNEKEGKSLTSYRDGAGIWTICRGVTRRWKTCNPGNEVNPCQMRSG